MNLNPNRPVLSLGLSGVVPISLKNSSAVEGTHYATQLQKQRDDLTFDSLSDVISVWPTSKVNLQPYPEFSLSLLEERTDTEACPNGRGEGFQG